MPTSEGKRIEELKKLSEITDMVTVSSQTAMQISLRLINSCIPLVLYGPPGTGKTRLTKSIQEKLKNDGSLGLVQQIQFHKEFTYEDFIEGYAPDSNGKYFIKEGAFKSFCLKVAANKDLSKINLFIIDEINRAEISSVFGEVLYLIEDRDNRVLKTAHSQTEFSVPENIAIIGTMNTADKNIAILDFALRRRFVFIPVFPDYAELHAWLNGRGFNFEDFNIDEYVTAAEALNKRILSSPLMGKGMQLGQSMFVPRAERVAKPIELSDIIDHFNLVVFPQLESYTGFGYENELSKILNPAITYVLRSGGIVTKEYVIGLIKSLAQDKQGKPND